MSDHLLMLTKGTCEDHLNPHSKKRKLRWGCLASQGLIISRDSDSIASLGDCAGLWLTSWWRTIPDQLSQAVLGCPVLHLPTHLGDCLLGLLQYFNVCFALGMPKLDMELQVLSHKHWVGGSNPFPWPAGCTVSNTDLFTTRASC